MKVLVTGAAGVLGRAVVRRLLRNGYDDMRCIIRDESRRQALDDITTANPAALVEVLCGSLDSVTQAVAALRNVGLVFHFAAGVNGTAERIHKDTVTASRNLLVAMSVGDAQPAVMLASSLAVYGVGGLPRDTLVDETTPLEGQPELRDNYSRAKILQEQLFIEHQARAGFPLVILRPGPILAPEGIRLPMRVGMRVGLVFLAIGGNNPLPLTYVDNCAAAFVIAAENPLARGGIYNVVDDELPTCREYLRRYEAEVENVRAIPLSYELLRKVSKVASSLSIRTRTALSPYRAEAAWGGHRFSNSRLKGLGWRPTIAMEDALSLTFRQYSTS